MDAISKTQKSEVKVRSIPSLKDKTLNVRTSFGPRLSR
jgi:hypothetical protein